MKVLVTGASGFLGGHMAEGLIERGYSVVAQVRRGSDTTLLKEMDLEMRVADLTDYESLLAATKGVDVVIHLAAYYTFHGKRDLYRKINVEGTRSILEASAKNGISHFIYCSTTEAIGRVNAGIGDENTPPNPEYEYGKSKLMAEGIVKSFGSKVNYTIIRPSGIYGPRNVDDVSYWLITSFAKNSISTRFVVGDGENRVQFAHVKDIVSGFLASLEHPEASKGQTYIISYEKAYSYNEVYAILGNIVGRPPPSLHVPPLIASAMVAPVEALNRLLGKENFMWHRSTVRAVSSDRAYSIEKAKREIGFVPKYDLETGLKETVKWYKENGYL